jgi:membrane associated rhomboid family serine protease
MSGAGAHLTQNNRGGARPAAGRLLHSGGDTGDKLGVTSVPPVSHSAQSRSVDLPPPPREPAIRIPPVTGLLIAMNVVVEAVLSVLPPDQAELIVNRFGFDPADLLHFDAMSAVTLITYQFLHGGWTHLGVNMVSLLAFGPGIERPIGRARFLAVYFVSGISAALIQAAFTVRDGDDLLIGASGSISGVFGALIVIWGMNRRGRNPMGMLPMTMLWIVLMAVTGISGVGAGGAQVAWIAHIGGFVVGIALGALFKAKAFTRG